MTLDPTPQPQRSKTQSPRDPKVPTNACMMPRLEIYFQVLAYIVKLVLPNGPVDVTIPLITTTGPTLEAIPTSFEAEVPLAVLV